VHRAKLKPRPASAVATEERTVVPPMPVMTGVRVSSPISARPAQAPGGVDLTPYLVVIALAAMVAATARGLRMGVLD
jgi:hypothetical protein